MLNLFSKLSLLLLIISFYFKLSYSLTQTPKYKIPAKQWHLKNTIFPGNDVNIEPVWDEGITGKGVTICIIDDGVDFNHPQLKHAIKPDLSHDFNAKRSDRLPTPLSQEDRHGTRCAGQIAAHPEGPCEVIGVAPDASISAIRLLGGRINVQKESAAVIFRNDKNDIYSCSWGPADDGKTVEGPEAAVLKSFISGLLHGRNGKGSIFVFAAGNGQLGVDNCNYDGYANGAFALTIGAVGADNKTPYYMEECATMLAVTYSSGGESSILSSQSVPRISTIDIEGTCTDRHGGTSAAAPLAAGIMALALSIRPDLTWRDMQELIISSAVRINPTDPSWIQNSAGRFFSPRFGFGKIDAHRLVTSARDWKLLLPPQIKSFPWINVRQPIEAISGTESSTLSSYLHLDYALHWSYFDLADLGKIERVSVSVQVQHARRGDLIFLLCSPAGTCVPLTSTRPNDDDSQFGLMGWTFSTVAFWGENEIIGTWTLKIQNSPQKDSPPRSGQFIQWRLTLWTESTLQSAISYSKDRYAMDFLNNYFPPTVDYFSDRDRIWATDRFEKLSFSGPIDSNFKYKHTTQAESDIYRNRNQDRTVIKIALIFISLICITGFLYQIIK